MLRRRRLYHPPEAKDKLSYRQIPSPVWPSPRSEQIQPQPTQFSQSLALPRPPAEQSWRPYLWRETTASLPVASSSNNAQPAAENDDCWPESWRPVRSCAPLR